MNPRSRATEAAVSKPVTVDLPENLTIANAEALYNELDAHSSGSQDVILNAQEVARADTAGLQLLYLFQQTLQQHQASVLWQSPSTALLEASEQLGMKHHLGLAA